MATPKFTTPFKPAVSPALNYVSPVAKDAKFDSMSGTLALAGKGIELAMEVDKANIVRTAEENAALLSDAYKSQSPSEINYWSQAKNTAELKLAADPEDPYWLKMLNESQNKLVNAQNQGKISAYEFQQRSRQLIDQQLKDNPAYSAEIIKTVKNKYSELGIMDVIKTDEDLLKSSSEANAKEITAKRAYLEKQGSPNGDPYKMNSFDLDINYALRLSEVTQLKTLEERVTKGGKLNTEEMDKVKAGVIKNPGGLPGAMGVANTQLELSLQDIFDSTDSNDIKRRKAAKLINVTRLTSATMVDSMGGGYTNLLAANNKFLDGILVRANNIISGESNKIDLKNDLELNQISNELFLRLNVNPEMLELNKKLAQIWEIIYKKDPNFEPNQEQFYRVMKSFTEGIFNTGARIMPDSPEFNNGLSRLFTTRFSDNIPRLSLVAKEMLKDPNAYGKLDGMTTGNFTNVWNVSSQHTNMSTRSRASDSVIKGITNMDQEVFDYMSNNIDFLDGYNEELKFSSDVIDREIASLTDSDTLPAIGVISGKDGKQLFRSTDSQPRSISLAERLNNHVRFMEKMNGPSSNDPNNARRLFPRIFFPSITSEEEYNALNKGDIFVDSSGQPKKK